MGPIKIAHTPDRIQ